MYKIFLSHAAEDNELAGEVVTLLEKSGIEVFASVPGYPIGLWPNEVRDALEQSGEFWLLLTEYALVRSAYVHHEFGYFYGYLRRKMASTDVRFVGNRLRLIANNRSEELPGMYRDVQAFLVDSFEPRFADQIVQIISRNIGAGQERWDGSTPVGALMDSQRYEVAVDAYTRMLEIQPKHHSLLVGRAKAKWHLGDVSGAWEDYHAAKEIAGNLTDILNLERLLREAHQTPRPDFRPRYQDDLDEGNRQLANGDFKEALDAYEHAAYKRVEKYGDFPLHNAMAFLCGSDTKSARGVLEKVKGDRQDPDERVVSWALRAIACALDSQDSQEIWVQLQSALAKSPQFSFIKSPLRHLEAGMHLTGALRQNVKVLGVFKALPGSRTAAM